MSLMIEYPKNKPESGDICLCECPSWCSLGYQIAEFNGKKFDYPESPNDDFDKCVSGFILLKDFDL